MRYGRAIVLAGLVTGLVGLAPVMVVPRMTQTVAQTVEQRKAESDRQSEGDTLNNIGMTHHQLEQYPQALEFYQQALGIRREVGNRRREGISLSSAAVGIDGRPIREIMGEQSPRTAGSQQIKDAIEDFTQVSRAGALARFGQRESGLNQLPLDIA